MNLKDIFAKLTGKESFSVGQTVGTTIPKDIVLADSVNGHTYRYTSVNGQLSATDLGVTQ